MVAKLSSINPRILQRQKEERKKGESKIDTRIIIHSRKVAW